MNPFDIGRVCGGSSGGDAALVAARCVPLALGTDIGGSIRVPAAFTGIFGFKPTANRVSYKGCILPLPDGTAPQTKITASAGPLAASVSGLKLATEALLTDAMFEKDFCIPPIPFSNINFNLTLNAPKLRFGFFDDLALVTPSASVKRAMNLVREKLIAAGHDVVAVPITEADCIDFIEIHMNCCTMGVFEQFDQALKAKGDAPISLYKPHFLFYNLPRFL